MEREIVLSELRVYPLKGARGLSVDSWEVDAFGPALDRRWMVADPQGAYLTQRSHPRLALLRPRLETDALVLSAPGMDPLRLDRNPTGRPHVEVTVWKGRCRALEAGQEAAEWMGAYLDQPARVVFMPEETFRPATGHPWSRVSFTDGYPFLMVSAEAVEELNRRLERPVSVDRFRPNLVVRGGGAHAEDRWRRVRIGDLDLRVVKACPRCSVTTVDQETAEKGREPLRTLSSYRRAEGGVYFGQNVIHEGPGTLRRGQAVQVLEEGAPRPDLPRPGRQQLLAETNAPDDK